MEREPSEAREHLLDAAEQLFMLRGYAAVRMHEVAAAAGIRQATLYHHFHGGKEELFIRVLERYFARHHLGLNAALAAAVPNIRAQLYATSDWLLSQAPMDLARMAATDLPAINTAEAERLAKLAYTTLFTPIIQMLHRAQQQGEIVHHDLALIAGGVLGLITALAPIPAYAIRQSRQEMAHELIDVMLNGLVPKR